MTAKEWLGRARTIEGELAALQEAREIMEAQLTKATQTMTGDTVQSSKDPHAFDRLGELAYQIEAQTKELDRVRAEIESAIRKVDNGKYRELLVRRYINGKTFEAVAVEMNYTWRQVHRIHGRALLEIAEVIKCHL